MIISVEDKGMAMSTSSEKTIPNLSTSDDKTFPVPALYPKYNWNLISNEFNIWDSKKNAFAKEQTPINIYPYLPAGKNASQVSPNGIFYEATNTDPHVSIWQKTVSDPQAEGDLPFYGGDQDFTEYYRKTLNDLGYKSETIFFDKNFNISTYRDSNAYALYTIMADGPTGSILGYSKYDNGKIRIIVISSDTTKNSIFVSDVISLQDLFLQKAN
jgi:hypothetical protein